MSLNQGALVLGGIVLGVSVKLYDEIVDGQVQRAPPGAIAGLQVAQVVSVALIICLSTTGFFYIGIAAVVMALADAVFRAAKPAMGINLDKRFYVCLNTAVAAAFFAVLLMEKLDTRFLTMVLMIASIAVYIVTDMTFYNEECSKRKAVFRAVVTALTLVDTITYINAPEAVPLLFVLSYLVTWFVVKCASGQLQESLNINKCAATPSPAPTAPRVT